MLGSILRVIAPESVLDCAVVVEIQRVYSVGMAYVPAHQPPGIVD